MKLFSLFVKEDRRPKYFLTEATHDWCSDFETVADIEDVTFADLELMTAAPELLAENERLKQESSDLFATGARLLTENGQLRASNQRLEVEAIQRQGESDRARLAARADIERLEARVAELEASLNLGTKAYLEQKSEIEHLRTGSPMTDWCGNEIES